MIFYAFIAWNKKKGKTKGKKLINYTKRSKDRINSLFFCLDLYFSLKWIYSYKNDSELLIVCNGLIYSSFNSNTWNNSLMF